MTTAKSARLLWTAVFVSVWSCVGFQGCGPGKYGSSVQAFLQGGVDAAESRWDADERKLAVGGPMSIEVDRACLVLGGTDTEPVSVTVMPPGYVAAVHAFVGAGGVSKEDCSCHGNPPHCHGDCGNGETGSASLAQPVSDTIRTAVDLTETQPQIILESPAVPGDYGQVLMTLGQADSGTHVPEGCGDMADRTFFLEGRLINETTGDATEVTVDITEASRVTEVLEAVSAAVAEPGHPARLRVVLLLDLALSHVDWEMLGRDSGSALLVGGEIQSHPVAVSEIMAGLGDHESYVVEQLN
jgi:hypothetical protein